VNRSPVNTLKRNWLSVLLGVFFIIILAMMVAPRFYQRRGGEHNRLLSNLRQLDGAKQQWVLAHGITGNVSVTEQDISSYLERFTGFTNPVMGERYLLNGTMESPEAELMNDFGGWRKGMRFLLTRSDPMSSGNEAYRSALAAVANEPVPLPEQTPYEAIPESKRAYLDHYQEGYRTGLAGYYAAPAIPGGRHERESVAGYYAGRDEGRRAWARGLTGRLPQREP
jgi:hypothetical protein